MVGIQPEASLAMDIAAHCPSHVYQLHILGVSWMLLPSQGPSVSLGVKMLFIPTHPTDETLRPRSV